MTENFFSVIYPPPGTRTQMQPITVSTPYKSERIWMVILVVLARFELATHRLKGDCSKEKPNQLSYNTKIFRWGTSDRTRE